MSESSKSDYSEFLRFVGFLFRFRKLIVVATFLGPLISLILYYKLQQDLPLQSSFQTRFSNSLDQSDANKKALAMNHFMSDSQIANGLFSAFYKNSSFSAELDDFTINLYLKRDVESQTGAHRLRTKILFLKHTDQNLTFIMQHERTIVVEDMKRLLGVLNNYVTAFAASCKQNNSISIASESVRFGLYDPCLLDTLTDADMNAQTFNTKLVVNYWDQIFLGAISGALFAYLLGVSYSLLVMHKVAKPQYRQQKGVMQ